MTSFRWNCVGSGILSDAKIPIHEDPNFQDLTVAAATALKAPLSWEKMAGYLFQATAVAAG